MKLRGFWKGKWQCLIVRGKVDVIYWSARHLECQVSVAIVDGETIDGEQTRYYLTFITNKMESRNLHKQQ